MNCLKYGGGYPYDMDKYYEKMLFALKEMPILDVHTHISADRPQARDIPI